MSPVYGRALYNYIIENYSQLNVILTLTSL